MARGALINFLSHNHCVFGRHYNNARRVNNMMSHVWTTCLQHTRESPSSRGELWNGVNTNVSCLLLVGWWIVGHWVLRGSSDVRHTSYTSYIHMQARAHAHTHMHTKTHTHNHTHRHTYTHKQTNTHAHSKAIHCASKLIHPLWNALQMGWIGKWVHDTRTRCPNLSQWVRDTKTHYRNLFHWVHDTKTYVPSQSVSDTRTYFPTYLSRLMTLGPIVQPVSVGWCH